MAEKKTASGMESMLRSMGLGEVIDAANYMAQSGVIQKVLAVANEVEQINARLGRIEAALGIASGSSPAHAEPERTPVAEPGAFAAINGVDGRPSGAFATGSNLGASRDGPVIEGELVRGSQ